MTATLRSQQLRIKRFLRSKRPLAGDPWEEWGRELVAMWDMQAWFLLTPPMTREAFLREAQVPGIRTVHRYREALKVLDTLPRLRINGDIIRRVPYYYLFRLHPYLGDEAVMQRAAVALSRGNRAFREFSRGHQQQIKKERAERKLREKREAQQGRAGERA